MNEPYTTDSGPEQSSGVIDSAKAEAANLKNTVREQAGQTAEKVKEEAKTAANHLKEAGTRLAHQQRDMLAERVQQYARDMRAAAERLRERGDANPLAGPAESAAAQLDQLSGYLQERSLTEMFQGLERLARRRPEIVFGGLFIAGLAAARFLKASGKATAGFESGTGASGGGARHLLSSTTPSPGMPPYQPSAGANWRSQHNFDDEVAGETPAGDGYSSESAITSESSTRPAL